MDGQPLVLASGRQPFEVLLLLACVVVGTVGFFGPRGSASVTIDEFICDPWRALFYGVLALSALVALVGVFLSMPDALLVERVGLLFLSGLLITYGISVYAVGSGGASGGIIVSFGVAAVLRCWQITRDLSRLRSALRAATEGTGE